MNEVKLAAANAVLSHFGLNKQASMRDILDKVIEAKNKYVAYPAVGLGAGVGAGYGAGILAPIDSFRILAETLRDKDLNLSERIGGGVGTLAGVGTLGYGAYRGGKALYNKLRPESPTQDVHAVNTPELDKQASMRDILDKVLSAKKKHLEIPIEDTLSSLGVGFGSGFGRGLVSPIRALRELPPILRAEGVFPTVRAGIGAGTLAGAGTLGYGAYRGGKALVHRLTADHEHE